MEIKPNNHQLRSTCLVLGLYLTAAICGLRLADLHPSVSPVWPATGVGLACVYCLGPRIWPGIWLGALIATLNLGSQQQLSPGVNLAMAITIACGNTFESLAGIWAVTQFQGRKSPFQRVDGVVCFGLFACVLAPMVSASLGVLSLLLAGLVESGHVGILMLTWWLGDMGGAITLAPFLIVLFSLRKSKPRSAAKPAEVMAMLLSLPLTCQFAFGGFPFHNIGYYPLSYLCLPPMLWMVFRYRELGATAATLIVTILAVWNTLNGTGPFIRETPNESLLLLQMFMNSVAVTALFLAAVLCRLQRVEQLLLKTNQALENSVAEHRHAIDASNALLKEQVSARARIEEAVQLTMFAMENAAIGMVNISPSGHILRVNPIFCSMLDFQERHLLGRHIGNLDPNLYGISWEQQWHIIKQNQNQNGESICLNANYDQIPVEYSMAYFEYKSTECCCLFIRDIAEKKQAQAERQQLEAQLQQSQKMETIGTLAGGIAHDFNNILHVIIGYADMIRESLPPGNRCRSYLANVLQAANRGKDLVQQILTFSRRVDHQMIPVELHIVLKETLKLLRSSIPTTISIHADIRVNQSTVVGNSTQLHQIIMNLCVNAI